MVKRLIYILVALIAFAGCEAEQYRTDLDGVRTEIDELTQRLDEFCKEFNTNLAALKAIVDASRTNDYIESVTPLVLNGKQEGYVIRFTQGGSIEIYHGDDAADGAPGADAVTPKISVEKDSDGIWYWTLGGTWLLNEKGEKIRAEAIVPQLKIEARYWYVSYDKGTTWVKLGKAVGEDGLDGAPGQDAPAGLDAHCVFSDVTLTDTEVVFTLLEGGVFRLPRHGRLDVEFDFDGYETNVVPGEEIRLRYTLKNASESTKMSVSSDGIYKVRLERASSTSGTLVISCPSVYKDGYVNVIMSDGNGYTAVRVLNFYESRIDFADGLEYRVPAEGGKIRIPFAANFEYTLKTAEESQSWLTFVKTKAVMTESEIEVTAAANTEAFSRTGRIRIVPVNSDAAYKEIIINQSSTVFTIDKTRHEMPVEGGQALSVITSNDGLSITMQGNSASWISCDVVNTVENVYELKIKAYANYGAARTGKIALYSADGSLYHGEVEVYQNAMEEERPDFMVFVVKTNMYSDNMVYLPLAGNLDCLIDWGDGSAEVVKKSVSYSSSDKVSHKYDVTEPTEFTVRISGIVPRLSSTDIPAHSVIEVKQWGLTGLTSLESAFNGNQRLVSVSTDAAGSFADVTNCRSMFSGCLKLVALPDGIFDNCSMATDFSGLCCGCISLQYIPDAAFRGLKSVTTFSNAFEGCSSLTDIPAGLFAGCSNVTSFNTTFSECSSLKALPSDMFEGCISVTDFSNTFDYCTSLSKIPEGLFDDCHKVTTFWYTFWMCSSLVEIPTSLFDNQRWVKTFQTTFSGCSKLTGESPYTMLNGEKVHLYEREKYPDYFVIPTQTSRCFSSCSKLTDYSSIPSSWR